ncbi:hypothetical protein Syun_012578 [Stephania yunnanensis]|uniref:Phosphatidic acid phosphatase type 2/haloperoxidase domain-containing protein n=1 Tax=Stephania yunnanensis TaxID=152371 RepID=A0AAP0K129_9MAGN
MEDKQSSEPNRVGPTETKPHTTTPLSRLINLDATWSLHLHTICAPIFPRTLLKSLEISGDGRFWFPIPIAVLLSPLSTRSLHVRWIVLGLLIGSLLDLLLVGLVKYAVKRPRPVYNKGMHLTVSVDHWSFPSGHSSRVCFVASFLCGSLDSVNAALVELRGLGCGKIAKAFVWIVCLWSVVTSFSRVLLGRHFVLDVLAGACLGVVEAWLVFWFLEFGVLD